MLFSFCNVVFIIFRDPGEILSSYWHKKVRLANKYLANPLTHKLLCGRSDIVYYANVELA